MNYNITVENNQEVLCIYLDYSEEIGDIDQNHLEDSKSKIANFIKNKGIHFKGNMVKIFVGSVLLGTLAMGTDQINTEAATVETPISYQVQSGDSLYTISRDTGLSIAQIKEINRLTTDMIQPGQELMLRSNAEIGYYVVKSGDSLYSISRSYGMSINELKEMNRLSNDTLQPGQSLKVLQASGTQDPYSATQFYTVKSGDNLSTIASRHNMTTSQLRQLNNLTTDVIQPGQVLRTSGNTATTSPVNETMYTVVSGDNLSTIASRHNMTTSQLRQLNNLTTDLIRPGQILRISGQATTVPVTQTTYTVRSGDNLSTIANRNNMTTNQLKQLNNLTTDLIYPGQVLQISGVGTVAETTTYTVRSGDNLSTIANRYNMTTNQLRQLNNLTTDLIIPGQVLRISGNNVVTAPNEVQENLTVTIRRSNGAVQTIGLEEYVIGVVSAEMYPHFNAEALKAQALTARTYAANYTNNGKVLSDTDSHQVYYDNNQLKQMWGTNFDAYYAKMQSSVMATRGEVITYEGQYIDALFFSTSNGRTDEPEYVWGGSLPYLQSVESPWDTESREYSDVTTMSYTAFRSRLGIASTQGLYAEVLSRTPGNGIERINIAGTVYTGETARRSLGLRSTDYDITFSNGTVTIEQRGWGHRVGMSQYGAHYMGVEGYTYDQIIHHYYQGVTIEKI